MGIKHFVYTESGKLIDTHMCLSATSNGHIICYRKNKFVPEREEKVIASANSVVEVAELVIKGIIPGVVFTMVGSVANGVYTDTLSKYCGPGKVVKSIWINTDMVTMRLWWNRGQGIIK